MWRTMLEMLYVQFCQLDRDRANIGTATVDEDGKWLWCGIGRQGKLKVLVEPLSATDCGYGKSSSAFE